jgi:geranylgeranyl diphosphate synthase type I
VSSRTSSDEDALLAGVRGPGVLHASALVHDDYMDASDTRAGRPATHRAFAPSTGEAGGAATRSSTARRGDPARRPAARVVRRAAAPLRLPADRVRAALELFDRAAPR